MNYIEQIAENIKSKLDPDLYPHDGADELFRAYAVLALAKGEEVTNSDVHNAWVAWAVTHSPESSSLIPYEKLTPDVQEQDTIFTNAIVETITDINHNIDI